MSGGAYCGCVRPGHGHGSFQGSPSRLVGRACYNDATRRGGKADSDGRCWKCQGKRPPAKRKR